jgi:hypothetical protein
VPVEGLARCTTPGGDASASLESFPSFVVAVCAWWSSVVLRSVPLVSNSGGIRHAADQTTTQPTQALAQYFLVTCSAFVNLVTTLKSGTP